VLLCFCVPYRRGVGRAGFAVADRLQLTPAYSHYRVNPNTDNGLRVNPSVFLLITGPLFYVLYRRGLGRAGFAIVDGPLGKIFLRPEALPLAFALALVLWWLTKVLSGVAAGAAR